MRRFRVRKAADGIANEPRRRAGRLARWIYVGALAVGALWFADFLGGKYLHRNTEGMVVSSAATVATEFSGTVQAVWVKEGEALRAGDIVATLSSFQVAESLARLNADIASKRTRLAELRIRAGTLAAMLGSARERAEIAVANRAEFEKLVGRGLLPIDRRVTAVEAEFRAKQDAKTLAAEYDATTEELTVLTPVIGHAERALARLSELYADGVLRMPIDGHIGKVHVVPGTVVKPGDPVVDVYGRDHYVLAYVTAGGMYEIAPGDAVTISWGVRSTQGYVAKVEPVAMALPVEFQRTFNPVERGQIVRIAFSEEETPPLFAKLHLSFEQPFLHWAGRLVRLGDTRSADASRPPKAF